MSLPVAAGAIREHLLADIQGERSSAAIAEALDNVVGRATASAIGQLEETCAGEVGQRWVMTMSEGDGVFDCVSFQQMPMTPAVDETVRFRWPLRLAQ